MPRGSLQIQKKKTTEASAHCNNIMYGCLGITDECCHVSVLFAFWPYLSCQQLNSLPHSWSNCFYCMMVVQPPWPPETQLCITFSSDVRRTDWRGSLFLFFLNANLLGCLTAVWQNMLLLHRNVKKKKKALTFTALWKSPGKSCDRSVLQTCYLTTCGRKVERQRGNYTKRKKKYVKFRK